MVKVKADDAPPHTRRVLNVTRISISGNHIRGVSSGKAELGVSLLLVFLLLESSAGLESSN